MVTPVKFWIFLIVLIASFSFLFWNLRKIFSYLRLAKSENRMDRIGDRIMQTIEIAFFQSKILREKVGGLIHIAIFWGFLVLLFSASEAIIQGFDSKFSWKILGPFHDIIAISTDLFCGFIVLAIIFALLRRYVFKVKRLQGDMEEKRDAIVVLGAIFIIVFSLLMESAAMTSLHQGFMMHMMSGGDNQPWKPFASMISGWIPFEASPKIYKFFWWTHILGILGFMNYLPYSKHFHVYTSIPNTFFATIGPVNKLKPIDFEKETEKFGVTEVEDLTWKQILDGYTCTHCGRCDDVCPANHTGKVLSPRNIMVEIRNRTADRMPILKKQAADGDSFTPSPEEQEIMDKKFIGDYQNIEALWQCTTCGACMKECPVMNEHVPAIIDMRRSLVMMESNFPAELQGTFSNLETNGTPWAFSQAERADWAEGTGVKTASENPEFDVLFWVGCAGSFDDRARKISIAFSKLMQSAGINFSILGTEEQCTGDSARRAGNEYLADMLIKSNIETLSKYNVKKIVTTCPHCFNTLKNEFPDFGGQYEVVHHTQFLQNLISEKKLKISPDGMKALNVAYHDSCYLGRYNEEYSAPRQVISSIPGLRVLEPKRTADKGFCCGAGGAQMFMEETQGKRVNIERTEELLATGAKDIAVNCPFCMTMITDGVKAKEREDVKVRDISEILLEHIQQ